MSKRTSLRRRIHSGCFSCAILAVAGCEGDSGTEGDEIPGPPAVTPLDVPESPETIASTSTCVARRQGEELLSVSPEGHAWLFVAGSPTSLRVLDAFGDEMVESISELDIEGVVAGQAWSSTDAALLAGDSLWRLDDLARIELRAPDGFESPGSLCGDPGVDGSLLSAGVLFERRDSEWYSWSSGLAGDAAPSSLVRYDGECRGPDDLLWASAADGTLFRVSASELSRPVRFEGLSDVRATDAMLAVLDRDRLWIGPDAWQAWQFPGPVPAALTASNGNLWMMSGSDLLRFDGSSWARVEHGLSEPIERVAAYASGVWLVGSDSICHEAIGPELRVEGVRPYARSTQSEYALRVRQSDGDEGLTVDVDGAGVELAPDGETGWLAGVARLDSVGWHTIAVDGADASRQIHVKRVPEITRSWATDVEPIYQASCTGGSCHGSADAPDLTSYDAWVARASALRTRVVDDRTMPPAASVDADWGDDDITIIQEWLEGEMLP